MANPRLCSAPDCIKPAYLGDLCAMHRTRMIRHGSLDLPNRKSTRKNLDELLGGVTQFHDLTVIGEEDGPSRPGNGTPRLLRCRCKCGSVKLYPLSNVKRGLSKSCGCKRAIRVARSKTTHGQGTRGKVTPEYRCWAHIIGRCENPNDGAFDNYGGRGIKVCKRWRDSFEVFFEDMGPRPIGCSIDRIDVDGDYEPTNCRWATKHVQDRNKRTNRVLVWRGRKICLKDAAKEAGLHRTTVERRLARGWSVARALETPGRG